MSFGAPQWLWALLLIPIAYLVFRWRQRRRSSLLESFASRKLWDSVAPEFDPTGSQRKFRFWLIGAFFLIVSLARPQWGQHEEVIHLSGLDIFVVLDVSNSMQVEDIVPSRIKKAKHLIRNLLDQLSGDRVGIVAFAASSFIASPLTNDLSYVRETVDILGPQSVTNQGTDIGIALETGLKALRRGAEQNSDPDVGDVSRAIVLITDGEDHENKALPVARQFEKEGIKLYVIGVGSQNGGPVPIRDEAGRLRGYKRGQDGKTVVSEFKPESLIRLASESGGRYWTATPGEGEVDEIIKDLGTLTRGDFAERRIVRKEDRFQFPLAFSILFFLLEMMIPARKSLRSAASAAVLLILISPEPVFANPLDVYIENERGLEALEKGDAEQAGNHFGKAKAGKPGMPELEYNQGVSSLAKGDHDSASFHFDQAAKKAILENKNDLAANALFNRGVAYSKLGDAEKALRSYLNSVELAQVSGNTALEQEARKNIERLIRQEEMQAQAKKNQQQASKESKEGEQKQKQDKNVEDSSQDQNDQNEQAKSDSEQENASKESAAGNKIRKDKQQNFNSKKLSKEDAERVMKELSSREKELQAKMKKQGGKRSEVEKDW